MVSHLKGLDIVEQMGSKPQRMRGNEMRKYSNVIGKDKAVHQSCKLARGDIVENHEGEDWNDRVRGGVME